MHLILNNQSKTCLSVYVISEDGRRSYQYVRIIYDLVLLFTSIITCNV